jgi:DNA-binding Lrp family transcriptional regulator
VAVTDIGAYGFHYQAFVAIEVADRPAGDVAQELAGHHELMSVNVTSGTCDVVVRVLAHDGRELARVIGEIIPSVQGVRSVQCEWAVELMRYSSHYTALGPNGHHAPPLPLPGSLDSLDGRIIELLRQDARVSNRRIGASLGVSEGTIRTRVRRLQEEGFIRIQAICDSTAFGQSTEAFIGLRASQGRVSEVRDGLLALEGIPVLVRTVGSFDFLMLVRSSSRAGYLARLREEIAHIPGMGSIRAFEIEATVKHDYSWTRIR